MSDTPAGRRLCAHAHDDLPMHWLEPGESCRPKVETLWRDIQADLDRIEAEGGPAARVAAIDELLTVLEARVAVLSDGTPA